MDAILSRLFFCSYFRPHYRVAKAPSSPNEKRDTFPHKHRLHATSRTPLVQFFSTN